ncbi:MAG TPA: 8-amino-7-oxononanoate synthase [Flavobacterium sp.]
MNTAITFKIYRSTSDLPSGWDAVAAPNIFLQSDYLAILQTSCPNNMMCHFIGLFKSEVLIGVALSQFLNLSDVESFGERDKKLKTTIRQIVFKSMASNVLVLGNNMLSGQNAYIFNEEIQARDGLALLDESLSEIKRMLAAKGIKTHLTIYKDFPFEESENFTDAIFSKYSKFTTQPSMQFAIDKKLRSFDDYVARLNKKYRDQYKRARKKSEDVLKRKLDLHEIIRYNAAIYKLYRTVAANAPFNTFYLPEDHFIQFKKCLKDEFLFYGYFIGNELVGFNTLIRNGSDIDTYFLGYNETCQREKMLYLNMLYDMIGYTINKGFKEIIFARTALEIKSSVGAKPVGMFGYIHHSNKLINAFMPKLFRYFEPETQWKQRHPFKDSEPQPSSALEG